MTDNTKRQLRAEAVERLKNLESSGVSYMPSDVLERVTPLPNANIATLIDLLTDDESPEGDAMESLRGFIDDQFVEGKETWNAGMAIADMVERDYVRRDDYDFMVSALKFMTAERDEWKAKAEHVGVKRGMTNLEYLYGHDAFFNRLARWYFTDCGVVDDDVQADEWLMAEYVDEMREHSLEPESHTLEPESGQREAENAPDCARNDAFAFENGISGGAEGSNDANLGTAEAEASQVPESDTREKLEADASWEVDHYFAWTDNARVIAKELREFVSTHLIALGNGQYEEYGELNDLADRIEKLAKGGA